MGIGSSADFNHRIICKDVYPGIVHMPFEIKDDSIILFLRIYNDNSLKLSAVSSDPVGAMMTSRKFASSSSLASIENHDH